MDWLKWENENFSDSELLKDFIVKDKDKVLVLLFPGNSLDIDELQQKSIDWLIDGVTDRYSSDGWLLVVTGSISIHVSQWWTV